MSFTDLLKSSISRQFCDNFLNFSISIYVVMEKLRKLSQNCHEILLLYVVSTTEALLMSTHNTCYNVYGEIRQIDRTSLKFMLHLHK